MNVLQRVGDIASAHLATIAQMFNPPVHLTLVVRSPELPDGDMVLTDDDLDLAIGAIENLKLRPGTHTDGTDAR